MKMNSMLIDLLSRNKVRSPNVSIVFEYGFKLLHVGRLLQHLHVVCLNQGLLQLAQVEQSSGRDGVAVNFLFAVHVGNRVEDKMAVK